MNNNNNKVEEGNEIPIHQVEQMEITNENANNNNNNNHHKEEDNDSSTDPLNSSNEEQEENNDKDDDTSSTTSVMSTGEDSSSFTLEQMEERLIQATTWKEQGNTSFQTNDWDTAARAYRKGVSLLKPILRSITTTDTSTNQEQCQALSVVLQTNLSMVCYKQEKFAQAQKIATNALQLDPTNIKALYRRAMAYRAMGQWEEAKMDLKQALQQDPNNTACKKELVSLKKQIDGLRTSQKKALAKAFANKSSSFLYDDKEAEEKRKEEEKQRQKQLEQELYKKRKAQWEDECVSRMAQNEPAISFEEWEKEQKEIENAKKKAQEEEEKKKRREERKKLQTNKTKNSTKKKNNNDDDDDDDDTLTEEELKMMRGYKKTKDGRTTSYFTRELSAEEKQNMGDMAPKRLDEAPQPVLLSPTTTSTTAAAASKWNQAGTWEEKDTTPWCKDTLEQRLKDTTVSDNTLEVSIAKVDELTGDASVAITGGKKRYIFDFHVKLKYEIKEAGTDDIVAKGTVSLPDICSGHHEEIEINFSSWSKKPSSSFQTAAQNMQQRLAQELRTNIQAWVQEFNAQY